MNSLRAIFLLLGSLALTVACAHRTGQPRFPRPAAEPVVLPPTPVLRTPSKQPKKTTAPPSKPPAAQEKASLDDSLVRCAGTPRHPVPVQRARFIDTSTTPNGEACLNQLSALGVRYRKLKRQPVMHTGVVINGKLGGIRYYGHGGIPLILDCRLAVTLARLGPTLTAQGIAALRHSGAYVVRRAKGIRKRRYSLHAYGLAIDVHEVVLTNGKHLLVSKDYTRGLTHPCADSAPLLNRLACKLKQLGVFRELLTPDSNRAHWNHFHFAIARLRARGRP